MTTRFRTVRFEEVLASALAVAIGLNILAIANLLSAVSSHALEWLVRFGSWIPGIGPLQPFVGMETLALGGWLLGWSVLSACLRGREVQGAGLVVLFVAGMVLATLLLWPPTVAFLSGVRTS